MFKRILVAYDGSDSAKAALRVGIDLAKSADTELSSVSVEEHLPRYAATIGEIEDAKAEIEEHFHLLTKHARDAAMLEGVDLETVVRQGHEVKEILNFTRENRCDLLILGAHGHSRVFERVIGSTALSVARLSPCSVMIVRPRAAGTLGLAQIKRILVGLDGSPLGRLAFRRTLDLAVLCGASIVGATVHEVSPLTRPEVRPVPYIQQLGAAARERARAAGVTFEHATLAGHAAHALCRHARDTNADLLVLGATGLENPWSTTLGGTASVVASEAPCSVLLVRSPNAILHVRDVMVAAVSSVLIDASLAEVVELLLRGNIKAVPVLDARRHVVGVITGGDLLSRGDLDLRLSIKQELDAQALGERLRALRSSHRSARDVMTRRVYTVDADADLATAVRLMATHRVKRLPVVSQARELVGIVSRADVLRALAALPEPTVQAERELPAIARTVADAATIDVPVVPVNAPAEEVLQSVLENPLRRVVVVDRGGQVVGLISDRDILARARPDTRPWVMRVLRGRRAPRPPGPTRETLSETGLTAGALMGPLLITVGPEDSLAHAIRLMVQHGVKRLIVVDADRRFRGLVDRREILRLLAGRAGPSA